MSLWKTVSAFGLCAGAGLFAQEVPAPPPDTLNMKIMADGVAGGMSGGIRFMTAELGVPGKTVKGLPYQAQAITETTQTLADGNRIVHKSTALLARDSEGRTRREQKIDAVGQWSTGEQPPPLVFINDPVAQTSYVLESNTKTARKMSALAKIVVDAKAAADDKMAAETKFTTGGAVAGAITTAGPVMDKPAPGEIEKESLGTKTIEGVAAEGTRFTRTVPAGKMGNDRPLTYVNETWYSSELGMTVMSRHSDPQMGETVYTLTNIQRAEPDPSLFTVPAGYTVQEGGPGKIFFEKHEN